MKEVLCCLLYLACPSAYAEERLLSDFMPERVADLPFSVERNYYTGKTFKDVDREQIDMIIELLSRKHEMDIFNARSEIWAGDEQIDRSFVSTSEIECVKGIRCILFNYEYTWLITLDADENIIDAALVYASIVGGNGKGAIFSVAKMESVFGMGGYFTRGTGWSIDFKKTGIFCSEYIGGNPYSGLEEDFKAFKRRVNENGGLESKQIDDWEQCNSPW